MAKIKHKRPYVKIKKSGSCNAIFNCRDNIYIKLMIEFCTKHTIVYVLKSSTKPNRTTFSLMGNKRDLMNLKVFLKTSYDDYHHYNRQIKQYTDGEIQEI